MKAELLVRRRTNLTESSFVEIVIWKVPRPVAGSEHALKYRMAYVVEGNCLLRYDNEAGKGDHRHVGDREYIYHFMSIDRLVADFLEEVEKLNR